jgi:hypothetical protein
MLSSWQSTIDPKAQISFMGIDKMLDRVSYPLSLMQEQFPVLSSKRLPGMQAKLATTDRKVRTNLISNLDKILGGISYPIYLMHMQFAFLVSKLVPGMESSGLGLFCSSLPVIIIGSLFVHLTIEQPLENLRNSVKKSTISS